MVNDYNNAYLIMTIFVAVAVVIVIGMVGYLVWDTNQPPGWTANIKNVLSQPMFGPPNPDPAPAPASTSIKDFFADKERRENRPCQYISANISGCTDVDFSRSTGYVTANCEDLEGNMKPTALNVNGCNTCSVTNVNGTLGCADGAKPGECSSLGGNWFDQCRINFNPSTGAIVSDCPKKDGSLVQSAFALSNCNTSVGCLINNLKQQIIF